MNKQQARQLLNELEILSLHGVLCKVLEYRSPDCLLPVMIDSVVQNFYHVNDSAHKAGFILALHRLLNGELSYLRNFDFKNNFLKEEITINNIVHEAGYLIRHPKTNMDTSVDQFYPLMSGLYMWWDDFDKKEKDRIERAYNLVKDSGWKLKRDTWYKKIMKGTIFPPFRLMALICTREMAVNKKLKWKHKAIRWCTDFLNFFYLSIVLWFTPTHKIQQLLVLEQNSLAYETLFNKINKVLYYNMFDVRKTFDVYFRYKESALWHQNFAENPPINLLVKYWLRRRG